jgi:hypothetical protein
MLLQEDHQKAKPNEYHNVDILKLWVQLLHVLRNLVLPGEIRTWVSTSPKLSVDGEEHDDENFAQDENALKLGIFHKVFLNLIKNS